MPELGGPRTDAWAVAKAALRWNPCLRPAALQLNRDWPWLALAAQASAAQAGSAAAPQGMPKGDNEPQPQAQPAPLATTQGQVRSLKEVLKLCESADGAARPPSDGTLTCRCSGHCYTPGHRYAGGCTSTDVSATAPWCPECECSVPACRRPRLRSVLCSAHSKVDIQLPLPCRLVRAAGGSNALALVPPDMEDFLVPEDWPDDLPFLIVAALLKEPTAMKKWAELYRQTQGRSCRDAEQMRCALESVARAMDDCPNYDEVSSLSRGGSRPAVAEAAGGGGGSGPDGAGGRLGGVGGRKEG